MSKKKLLIRTEKFHFGSPIFMEIKPEQNNYYLNGVNPRWRPLRGTRAAGKTYRPLKWHPTMKERAEHENRVK